MSAEPTMSSRHDNGPALVADVPTGLFIDGKWRPAGDGETFEVIDPATGNPLTSVASATVDDGRDAAAAAAAAQPEWAATAPRERAEILRRTNELYNAAFTRVAFLLVTSDRTCANDRSVPDCTASGPARVRNTASQSSAAKTRRAPATDFGR